MGYGDMTRPEDNVSAFGFAPRDRSVEASRNALCRTATVNGVSQGNTGVKSLTMVSVDIPELNALIGGIVCF